MPFKNTVKRAVLSCRPTKTGAKDGRNRLSFSILFAATKINAANTHTHTHTHTHRSTKLQERYETRGEVKNPGDESQL